MLPAAHAPESGYVLPARHPDVILGPSCINGWRKQHLVGVPGGGRVLTVGAMEHAVLAMLDGTVTVGEICAATQRGDTPALTPERLARLVGIFAQKGLLDLPQVTARPSDSRETTPAQEPRPATASRSRSFFRASWETTRAEQVLRPIMPVARFVWSGLGSLILVPMVLLALGLFVAEAPLIVGQARAGLQSWESAVLIIVALLVSLAIHELGHAAAALRWGGQLRAIGLRWRFPLLSAYADVPGYRLLPRLGQRLGTCFAGVWTSLLLMVPVTCAWSLAGGGPPGLLHVLAGVQTGLLASAIFNLVPLFGSDGYQMLSQLLGIRNLGQQSTRTLIMVCSRPGRRQLQTDGVKRLLWIYLCYAAFCVAAVVIVAALVTVAVGWWLSRWLGPTVGIVSGSALLLVMVAGGLFGLARTPPQSQTGGASA